MKKRKKKVKEEDYTYLYHHLPARPLKYVKDGDGYGWLCDKGVDPKRDLIDVFEVDQQYWKLFWYEPTSPAKWAYLE